MVVRNCVEAWVVKRPVGEASVARVRNGERIEGVNVGVHPVLVLLWHVDAFDLWVFLWVFLLVFFLVGDFVVHSLHYRRIKVYYLKLRAKDFSLGATNHLKNKHFTY